MSPERNKKFYLEFFGKLKFVTINAWFTNLREIISTL